MEIPSQRITVASDGGACRTFRDEEAAGRYAAELVLDGQCVLNTIAWPDGETVEFAAIPGDSSPPDLALDRLNAYESPGGQLTAEEVSAETERAVAALEFDSGSTRLEE